MPDRYIDQLTEQTAPLANDDLLVTYDRSGVRESATGARSISQIANHLREIAPLSSVAHTGDQELHVSSYVGSRVPPLPGLATGKAIIWRPDATNLGASTLDVGGTGAKNLTKPDGTPMHAGDLTANAWYLSVYWPSEWVTFGVPQVQGTDIIGVSVSGKVLRFTLRDGSTQTITIVTDDPQDELEAIMDVLAQSGGKLVRTWSNTGLSSTEGEVTISSGNTKLESNFQSTEAVGLDGDDNDEIALILRAKAGAVVMCRDNTGNRWLVFRSRGSQALAGVDTYGIYYNVGDIIYEKGITQYGTGWDTTTDGGSIYIIERHVLESELANYVKLDGTNVTNAFRSAVQRENESQQLSANYTLVSSIGSGLNKGEFVLLDADSAQDIESPKYLYFYAHDADVGEFQGRWTEGDLITFTTEAQADIDHRYTLRLTQAGFGLSGSLYGALVERFGTGAASKPANDTATAVTLLNEDIHRHNVVLQIFRAVASNIGGGGGAAGKIWGYVSTAANAAWRRLLDVLKLDADTAAKRADYRAALATGRLQKSVAGGSDVTLTAAEAAYDSIEFTGALTANVVVTLPAAPSGLRMMRNQTTGNNGLAVKASGQSDAEAVDLVTGDNAVFHHGGSLACGLPQNTRKWTNTDVGTVIENIATGLDDDDWITVIAEGVATGYTPETEVLTMRFGDISGTERLILTLNSQSAAVLVSRSGSSLRAKRGGGLTSATTIVYAERRSYSAETI